MKIMNVTSQPPETPCPNGDAHKWQPKERDAEETLDGLVEKWQGITTPASQLETIKRARVCTLCGKDEEWMQVVYRIEK